MKSACTGTSICSTTATGCTRRKIRERNSSTGGGVVQSTDRIREAEALVPWLTEAFCQMSDRHNGTEQLRQRRRLTEIDSTAKTQTLRARTASWRTEVAELENLLLLLLVPRQEDVVQLHVSACISYKNRTQSCESDCAWTCFSSCNCTSQCTNSCATRKHSMKEEISEISSEISEVNNLELTYERRRSCSSAAGPAAAVGRDLSRRLPAFARACSRGPGGLLPERVKYRYRYRTAVVTASGTCTSKRTLRIPREQYSKTRTASVADS